MYTDDGHYIISRYTRAQAINDNVLVDVSQRASEAGFTVPVALTRNVATTIGTIPQGSYEDETGRLWDLLISLFLAVRLSPKESTTIHFSVYVEQFKSKLELKAVSHPGDEGEHVITIMLPDES